MGYNDAQSAAGVFINKIEGVGTNWPEKNNIYHFAQHYSNDNICTLLAAKRRCNILFDSNFHTRTFLVDISSDLILFQKEPTENAQVSHHTFNGSLAGNHHDVETALYIQMHRMIPRKISLSTDWSRLHNKMATALDKRVCPNNLTLQPPVPHIFGFSFFVSTSSTTVQTCSR